MEGRIRKLMKYTCFVAVAALALAPAAMAATTIKLAHVDPAEWQSSKKGAAATIFKNIVEGESDMKVELFPAKALGNENELVQQAQEGTLHMALISGAMAKVCKVADVLNIPYTFASAPIAWSELPNALATGVVDGQENPVGVIYNNKLHKLQKFMTLDGHVYAVDFIVINDEFFQSLSDKNQALLKKAARTAGLMGRAIQQFNTAEGVTKVVAEGMQVYSPSAADMKKFKDAAQPAVVKWLRGELGKDAKWIDKLDKAVAKASKNQ